jgi:MoxR-like ATPase
MTTVAPVRKKPDLDGDVRDKLRVIRGELTSRLIERDLEVDLALACLLAGENLLLVGPPGCAKSLLLDAVLAACPGKKFSYLLTKTTTPEELFGPLDLPGLKECRYRRITTNRLPDVDYCFLDEIFKSSSAVLNTLLRILNERVFDNDGTFVKVPLRMCVTASNEWPNPESAKELSALFDRFLVRKSVQKIVSPAGVDRLLFEENLTPEVGEPLTAEELRRAVVETFHTPISDAAKEAYREILRLLASEGIRPGDRRIRKSLGVVKAAAYMAGDDEVAPEHLEILTHVLWDDPVEHPQKCTQIVGKISNPAGLKINEHILQAEEIVANTDPKDLGRASESLARLGKIAKELEVIKGDKAANGLKRVKQHILNLRKASIESMC